MKSKLIIALQSIFNVSFKIVANLFAFFLIADFF